MVWKLKIWLYLQTSHTLLISGFLPGRNTHSKKLREQSARELCVHREHRVGLTRSFSRSTCKRSCHSLMKLDFIQMFILTSELLIYYIWPHSNKWQSTNQKKCPVTSFQNLFSGSIRSKRKQIYQWLLFNMQNTRISDHISEQLCQAVNYIPYFHNDNGREFQM